MKPATDIEEFVELVEDPEQMERYVNEREVRDAADIAGNSDGRTFLQMLDDEIAEVNERTKQEHQELGRAVRHREQESEPPKEVEPANEDVEMVDLEEKSENSLSDAEDAQIVEPAEVVEIIPD